MADSMEVKKNKHLICYVPNKGTPWDGRFTINNIYPGKHEVDPITGKKYIPVEWKRVLSPGEGVVVDDDTYRYYSDQNRSMAFVDKFLSHKVIKPGDEHYSKAHGDVIKDAVIVDTSVYSIPAKTGTNDDVPLTPYKGPNT